MRGGRGPWSKDATLPGHCMSIDSRISQRPASLSRVYAWSGRTGRLAYIGGTIAALSLSMGPLFLALTYLEPPPAAMPIRLALLAWAVAVGLAWTAQAARRLQDMGLEAFVAVPLAFLPTAGFVAAKALARPDPEFAMGVAVSTLGYVLALAIAYPARRDDSPAGTVGR